MKIWPVPGTLLSLVSGSLPDATPNDLDDVDENEIVHVAPSGFGIEGDGYYVWDEDRREAEDWATLLASPAFPKRS